MPIKTDTIYWSIDQEIVNKGYCDCDTAGKKQLVEAEMISYTCGKMRELGLTNIISNGNNDDVLASMLLCIDSHLQTFEEKDEFFRHYTHYLLKIVESIQSCGTVWFQEDKEFLKEAPLIEFDGNGKWYSLTTHLETPPVNATLFVRDIFQNYFEKGYENQKKKLYFTGLSKGQS